MEASPHQQRPNTSLQCIRSNLICAAYFTDHPTVVRGTLRSSVVQQLSPLDTQPNRCFQHCRKPTSKQKRFSTSRDTNNLYIIRAPKRHSFEKIKYILIKALNTLPPPPPYPPPPLSSIIVRCNDLSTKLEARFQKYIQQASYSHYIILTSLGWGGAALPTVISTPETPSFETTPPL